jgi:hypothetical protein
VTTRATTEVDGIPISYLTAGAGGPLVLLLHGTYWSRVWQPVLDEIAAAGLRPVAVDFRACDRPIARIASASPRKRICEPCKTTNLPSRDGTRQVASSMVPTRVASASCGVTRSRGDRVCRASRQALTFVNSLTGGWSAPGTTRKPLRVPRNSAH